MPQTFRVTARRRISADPTSTALLLAAPTACELWPGVRRLGDTADGVVVETPLPGPPGAPPRTTTATVRAMPPRRLPTSFRTSFEVSGPGLPDATGRLELAYLDCPDSTCTLAELHLDCAPPAEGVALLGWSDGSAVIERMAAGFLGNLAEAAEQRSHAA